MRKPLSESRVCLFFVRNRVTLPVVKKKMPDEVLEYFKKQGAKGGKIGGKKRVANMTAEERSASAKKAAEARWGKKGAEKR
jgi:hypothetical protein